MTHAELFLKNIYKVSHNEKETVQLQFKDDSTLHIDIDSLRFFMQTKPMRYESVTKSGSIGLSAIFD